MTAAPPESPAAEYARGFALEHAHYRLDLPLWRRLAAAADGPVLDMGAATGRVAIDLARRGHHVCAADPSAPMRQELSAALAREDPDVAARVEVVAGRLEAPPPGRRFPLVLVAMNTMQVLVEPAERMRAFTALASALTPGGRLAFDVAWCSAEDVAAMIGLELPAGSHVTPDGTRVRQTSWFEGVDADTMTARFAIRIVVERPGSRREMRMRRHTVHLYTPDEIRALARAAGLDCVEALGDFEGHALTDRAETQVHVLARPAVAA